MPGVIALQTNTFTNYDQAYMELEMLNKQCSTNNDQLKSIPFIIVCDDSNFISTTLNNFLWVTFTRCNPSHDMYGIGSFTKNEYPLLS